MQAGLPTGCERPRSCRVSQLCCMPCKPCGTASQAPSSTRAALLGLWGLLPAPWLFLLAATPDALRACSYPAASASATTGTRRLPLCWGLVGWPERPLPSTGEQSGTSSLRASRCAVETVHRQAARQGASGPCWQVAACFLHESSSGLCCTARVSVPNTPCHARPHAGLLQPTRCRPMAQSSCLLLAILCGAWPATSLCACTGGPADVCVPALHVAGAAGHLCGRQRARQPDQRPVLGGQLLGPPLGALQHWLQCPPQRPGKSWASHRSSSQAGAAPVQALVLVSALLAQLGTCSMHHAVLDAAPPSCALHSAEQIISLTS